MMGNERRELKFVARAGTDVPPPSAATLEKLLAVTGHNAEALDYLKETLTTFLAKKGLLKEYEGLTAAVSQLVESVAYTEKTRDNGWNGKIELNKIDQTDFSSFHTYLAAKSADKIPAQSYTWHYSISDTSQHIRALEQTKPAAEQQAAPSTDSSLKGA